jgi:hypothetical protein
MQQAKMDTMDENQPESWERPQNNNKNSRTPYNDSRTQFNANKNTTIKRNEE